MELLVLDSAFRTTAALDTFESLIWTDRYNKCGDFEIYTPVESGVLSFVSEDSYLWLNGSEHIMIVEGIQIASDVESGSRLTITGRSLESILERRIVWGQTILDGSLQNGIQKLLDDNVIDPSITSRQIANFVMELSDDPNITALTIKAQYNGENLYEVIQTLCEANHIGFKVTLTDAGLFVFKLYAGIDRSYDQLTNPYVVFSPSYDNIINSNYVETKKTLRNVTLVGGEGEGYARKTTVVGSASGLDRREMFTDASDVSSTIEGGTLTEAAYMAQLAQRGTEQLAENIFIKSFEGQVETTLLYKYGEDFFMGDILQIANEYAMEAKVRVIEVVRSQDLSGISVYPTFTNIE